MKKISPAFIALALVAGCGGPGSESAADYDRPMEAPVQEVAVSGSRMAMSDESYSEPSPAADRPDVEPERRAVLGRVARAPAARLPQLRVRRLQPAGAFY